MKALRSAVQVISGTGLVLVASFAVVAAQGLEKQFAKDQFLKTKTCAGCDLSGVGFEKGTDLKGANLAGAKLAGASLYGVDLTDANLQGADLTNAVLTGANLSNANLSDTKLGGANLADATGANLAGAITTDATTCPDRSAGPCR